MTQKLIKFFINEIYQKPPKKSYPTNKTDVNHIDDIWSLAILDLKDYGPEIFRGYKYVLIVKDNFGTFGVGEFLSKKCSNNKGLFGKCCNKFKKETKIS